MGIRQEVADTQQAAEKAKEAKASEEQLPSQVLLLQAKGLKVRRGFRLCFEVGFQQMVQCIFTEIQSGKLRRGKCFRKKKREKWGGGSVFQKKKKKKKKKS